LQTGKKKLRAIYGFGKVEDVVVVTSKTVKNVKLSYQPTFKWPQIDNPMVQSFLRQHDFVPSFLGKEISVLQLRLCFGAGYQGWTFIRIGDDDRKIIQEMFRRFANLEPETAMHVITEEEINDGLNLPAKRPTKGKKTKPYHIDEAKKEGADAQHKRLVSVFAKYLKDHDRKPWRGSGMDLFTKSRGGMWIFEMKSLTKENERGQARYGIGQLFDYETTNSELLGPGPKKALAFERKPTDEIVSMVRRAGIFVYWLDEASKITGEQLSLAHLRRL